MIEMTRQEMIEQGKKLFGDGINSWVFVCPVCGKEQSNNDFLKLGIDAREKGYIGFSCIGRFIEGSYKGLGDGSGDKSMGCNYTLGGLFVLNKKTIKFDDKKFINILL